MFYFFVFSFPKNFLNKTISPWNSLENSISLEYYSHLIYPLNVLLFFVLFFHLYIIENFDLCTSWRWRETSETRVKGKWIPLKYIILRTFLFHHHHAFARPYEGVHRSTSLMSSSLLLQQCPVAGGRIVGALWGVAARTYSILLTTLLRSCRLSFSPAVLLASK